MAAAPIPTFRDPAAPRLLFVDDDPNVRRVLSPALVDAGYQVIEAGDPAAALTELERGPVDVALIDMRLPRANGLDLCREIRRRGRTPIVALTAPTDSTDVVAFLDAGADDYLTKPFEMRVLHARLRAVLRRAGGNLAMP